MTDGELVLSPCLNEFPKIPSTIKILLKVYYYLFASDLSTNG